VRSNIAEYHFETTKIDFLCFYATEKYYLTSFTSLLKSAFDAMDGSHPTASQCAKMSLANQY